MYAAKMPMTAAAVAGNNFGTISVTQKHEKKHLIKNKIANNVANNALIQKLCMSAHPTETAAKTTLITENPHTNDSNFVMNFFVATTRKQ